MFYTDIGQANPAIAHGHFMYENRRLSGVDLIKNNIDETLHDLPPSFSPHRTETTP